MTEEQFSFPLHLEEKQMLNCRIYQTQLPDKQRLISNADLPATAPNPEGPNTSQRPQARSHALSHHIYTHVVPFKPSK